MDISIVKSHFISVCMYKVAELDFRKLLQNCTFNTISNLIKYFIILFV